MMKKKVIIVLFMIIFGVGIVYSTIRLILRDKDLDKNNEIKEEINQNIQVVTEEKNNDETGEVVTEEKYVINFDKLKSENSDTVAYLKIKNSDIDYVVVHRNDNDYYLNHNFRKEYNSAGWIFADYRNRFDGTDKNIVVYGHSMKDGSMFGTMYKLFNSPWIDDSNNYDIIFNTSSEDTIYRVFSMYRIDAEDYYITTDFNSDSEYQQFLNTLKNRSYRRFDVELSSSDQILTLSTCTSDLAKRIVVHAKKMN